MDDDNLRDEQRVFEDESDRDTNPEVEMRVGEELPEDNDPPFSAPTDTQSRIDNTQQETDGNVDSHEWYDEGLEEASEAHPPESSTQKEGYDPFTPGTEADGIIERDKDEEENSQYNL